ncbi:hypothetical protein [Nocardioides houyundeii]|uniref:hypothetical protein n=1 Tax=Nocardioides houyundeii TaxID=2045452 RepID=UPI000DF2D5EC|nr:hypothetical protein [Nocardioides houyundeii]
MIPRYAVRLAALSGALVLALTACTEDTSDDSTGGSPQTSPESPTASAAAPLSWRPTGEPATSTVVVGGEWRAVVSPDGRRATLSRNAETGADPIVVPAPPGLRISQVLLGEDRAVVVSPPAAETGPTTGTVVDLGTGDRTRVRRPVPAAGGAWASYGDELRYPAIGPRGAYCLALLDLPSGHAQRDHCAGKGEGFSQVTMSSAGTAMLTFDDRRPTSCRTPVLLVEGRAVPIAEATPCRGWEAVATETGAVWSEVRDERQVSRGHVLALDDGTVTELGAGATGTLTPCGSSVYFAAAPARGEPTRVLAWRPGGEVQVAYRSGGTGRGFVSALECAGDVLNLTVLSDDGDEQLWAPVE